MNQPATSGQIPDRRKPHGVLAAILAVFFCAVFVSLGVWQLQRLAWKRDLIARVDARIHAPAREIPKPDEWPSVTAARDAYTHVSVTGRFLNDKESLVYASTLLGPGYWVMSPLMRADGTVVYVNRGYVPLDRKDQKTRPESVRNGPVTITGLLRVNEPGGTFLRSNVPDQGRWYSRDVIAMAKVKGIQTVAPFFVDADATSNPKTSPVSDPDAIAEMPAGAAATTPPPQKLPVGGLTVVRFPNSHLSYALTWFAMALLSLFGGYVAVRHKRR